MKDMIKALFFNESLRRWHFEDIVRETSISRERVNFFLKKLVREKFVFRIKPKGKMPYYTANRESEHFRAEKRIYGLKMLEEMFEHINMLKGVESAILFGSFARGDWSKSSDVDLFVYGDVKEFEKGKIESKINREIQLFSYKKAEKIKEELDPKLIPNIIKGFNIKGSLKPFEVSVNA